MCDGKNHPLITVFSDEPLYTEPLDPYHVIRWCPDCGAVVVDLEIDGRLVGHSTRMRFPELAYIHFIGGRENEKREWEIRPS
jgi:hypothetical protein